MKLRVTGTREATLIEILADNDLPANAQNPIATSEYKDVTFPEASGKLVIVSGMPMSAAVMIAMHYKNLFKATAIANPRNGVAEVVHSISPTLELGDEIPLT